MLYAIVSSPPCSLVLQFSGHATAHPSGFAHFSDSSPYSLLFTRHLLESFQLYTCLPSCHLLLGGSLEPRSAIPLRSAHPELHLLPSNLLQLHLQLLPHPLPAVTQSTSLVPHPSPCWVVYCLHSKLPHFYAKLLCCVCHYQNKTVKTTSVVFALCSTLGSNFKIIFPSVY